MNFPYVLAVILLAIGQSIAWPSGNEAKCSYDWKDAPHMPSGDRDFWCGNIGSGTMLVKALEEYKKGDGHDPDTAFVFQLLINGDTQLLPKLPTFPHVWWLIVESQDPSQRRRLTIPEGFFKTHFPKLYLLTLKNLHLPSTTVREVGSLVGQLGGFRLYKNTPLEPMRELAKKFNRNKTATVSLTEPFTE